jgi:hypothetical protein
VLPEQQDILQCTGKGDKAVFTVGLSADEHVVMLRGELISFVLERSDLPRGQYQLQCKTCFKAADDNYYADKDGLYIDHMDDVLVVTLRAAMTMELTSESGVLLLFKTLRYW